jgi:anti-sigma factor RsiW
MDCEEARLLHLLRDSGEADADQHRRLAEHLDACPACAAELAECDATLATYRRHRPLRVPPAEVRATLVARPVSADATPARASRRVLHLAAAAVATAAAAILAFLFLSGPPAGPEQPDPGTRPAPAPVVQRPEAQEAEVLAHLDNAGITEAPVTAELVDEASAELDSLDSLLAQLTPAGSDQPTAGRDASGTYSTDHILEASDLFSRQFDETLWGSLEL